MESSWRKVSIAFSVLSRHISHAVYIQLSIIAIVAMTIAILDPVSLKSRFWLAVVEVSLSQLQNGVFLNVTRPRAHGWKKHQHGVGPLARISCRYPDVSRCSSNFRKLPQFLFPVDRVNEKMPSSRTGNKRIYVFSVSSKVSFNTVWCTKKGRL